MALQPAYTYEPLNHNTECMRIIRILPGSLEDVVHIDIKTVPLRGRYTCLSYSWGLPSQNSILLNGQRAVVRDNLYAFLRQARASNIRDWMWIDSLCIDQANDRERNHQVRQMAHIYRGAHHVIMWLGTSQTSCPSLGPVSPSIDWRGMQDALRTIEQLLPKRRLDVNHKLWRIRREMVQQIPQIWPGLVCLRDNDYWSRLWITPEVILARHAVIWWNDLQFSWMPLAILMTLAWDRNQACPSYSTTEAWGLGPPCVATLTDLYCGYVDNMNWSVQQSFDLHTVLSFVDTLKCEDPRDRVYGMLSLASDGKEVYIDYEESLLSLFLRLRAHWASLVSLGFGVLWAGSCTHLANQLGITAYALEAHILELRQPWHWTPAYLLYTGPGQELCYRIGKGANAQEYRVYSLSSTHSPQTFQRDAVKERSGKPNDPVLCPDCQKYASDACSTLSIIRSKRLKLSLGTGLAPDNHRINSGIQAIRQRLGVYDPETSNTDIALDGSAFRNVEPAFLLISERERYSHAFVLPRCRKRECAQGQWARTTGPVCTPSWASHLSDVSPSTTEAQTSSRSPFKTGYLQLPRRIFTTSLRMIRH